MGLGVTNFWGGAYSLCIAVSGDGTGCKEAKTGVEAIRTLEKNKEAGMLKERGRWVERREEENESPNSQHRKQSRRRGNGRCRRFLITWGDQPRRSRIKRNPVTKREYQSLGTRLRGLRNQKAIAFEAQRHKVKGLQQKTNHQPCRGIHTHSMPRKQLQLDEHGRAKT